MAEHKAEYGLQDPHAGYRMQELNAYSALTRSAFDVCPFLVCPAVGTQSPPCPGWV